MRTLRRPRAPFYGWYIVGVALLAQMVSAGTQAYVIGIFLQPMVSELGWSRQSFSAVQTLSTAVMGALGLFIGGFIDRRGPRPLMLIGGVIAGASLMATGLVHSLWQFYLMRGVAQTIGVALCGSLVVNVTVARWFVVRRGTAVALASLGVSGGGVLMVPLVSWWVGDFGWRVAWVLLGLLVWLLILPSSLLMRRAPEDAGLLPDGMSAEEAAAYTTATKRLSSASEVHWTRREAVRTKVLWLIIIAYGAGMLGTGGLILHAVPMLTDRGFGSGTAALVISAWAWSAMLSKLVWGPLMDRFHPRYLTAVSFVMGGAAMVGILAAVHIGSAVLAVLAFVTYGASMGGSVPLQETIWASYFGRIHLGDIRAVAMPFSIVFSAGGPLLAGTLYDRSGSYAVSLLIFAAASVVGSLLVLLARPPGAPARAGPLATGQRPYEGAPAVEPAGQAT